LRCIFDTYRYYGSVDIQKIRKVFEHILLHGKISSLQNLSETDYKNIRVYENWLKTIRTQDTSIENMRLYYDLPIRCIKLSDNNEVSETVRKMCIYRQNLEYLTKSVVTVPAYKFYDIAIIILFLMNNPRLIVLPKDMLRKIATFVFNC